MFREISQNGFQKQRIIMILESNHNRGMLIVLKAHVTSN